MSDTGSYTDTELEALPQTEAIFDVPQLQIDQHTWVQQGNYIIEQCHDHKGIPIPSGMMLVKEGSSYKLVDELTRK